MNHIVFISHSVKDNDQEVANRVYDCLESNGIKCFMDIRDLVPGKPYPEQITSAIEQSRVIILVFSANSDSSAAVQNELAIATNNKISIIPLRIENVMPKGLAFFISTLQWLDAFAPPLDRHLPKLVDAINKLLDSKQEGNTVEQTKISGDESDVNLSEGPIIKDSRWHDIDKKDLTQSVLGRIKFSVVPWGHINMGELDNAIRSANFSQESFEFSQVQKIVPIQENRYILSSGALDLEKAARNLIKRKQFKSMKSNYTILVTSKPYSTPDADIYKESYYFDDNLTFAENVSIVSTYLWEQLPRNPALYVLAPDGRRSIVPFLHYCFAMIALDKCVSAPFAYHMQTFGCPFDYCYNPSDIDYFFKNYKFCDACNECLLKEVRTGKASIKNINSVKKLLNIAVGKPASYGFFKCFISYGKPDEEFAKKLDEGLRDKGIRTWMYAMNYTPGKRTWAEIIEQRRTSDKIIVICSALSLSRDGILKEIEQQIDEDPGKIIPVSIDQLWQEPSFPVKRGEHDLKPSLRDRNCADFATKPFNEALNKLAMALQEGTD
jgi:hypothetical protein